MTDNNVSLFLQHDHSSQLAKLTAAKSSVCESGRSTF